MANASSRIAPALASALPASDAFAQITLPAHEFHPQAIHEQVAWKRNLVILTTWEARLQAVTLIMLCPFVALNSIDKREVWAHISIERKR